MPTQKIEWNEKLSMVWDKTVYSLDFNIHKTIFEQGEFLKNRFQNDSSLTENEKKFLLNQLQFECNILRIGNNSIEKKLCNNCQNWHQAIKYCEYCIRKYFENNFENWTSGNDEIDKLIQECQQKIVAPQHVIEWISYDQFENIEYFTEGGSSTIYTAIWKDGYYYKWNSKKQILERFGKREVILKRLNNSNSNNVHWFREVTLSFTIDNTFRTLAKCFGLTKDPITNDYMLVLLRYNNDLRCFLINDYRTLTWLQKYRIVYDISHSLILIHYQNVVHRDLHSGNILHNANFTWYVSDLGLSGPVDKPLNNNSIYGNLPYIAPEVLCGQIYTTKSDIYSLGILMWEIVTGEIPFREHEYDKDLALAIVNGYRPKLHEEIPNEYADLMKQCWDANPDNRPDANIIHERIELLIKSLYNEMDKKQELTIKPKKFKSKIKNFLKLKSKIKNFLKLKSTIKNFLKPRSTKSKEEQNLFDSQLQLNDLIISDVDKDEEYGNAGPSNSGSQYQD
ncbi:hypothetical protein Glove_11g30 [Diversispora epigaea]|uniref:Protein kinase domain-containing protein n=1 Tax=Diversispora epigaea TaxID=1348612 RepID=A0A397JQ12_9GLOM|nr:hypothetical protein Glove_11g30 [Diversispora epigaea]